MSGKLALVSGVALLSAKVFAALVVGVIDGIEGSDYSAFCVPSRHEVLVARAGGQRRCDHARLEKIFSSHADLCK